MGVRDEAPVPPSRCEVFVARAQATRTPPAVPKIHSQPTPHRERADANMRDPRPVGPAFRNSSLPYRGEDIRSKIRNTEEHPMPRITRQMLADAADAMPASFDTHAVIEELQRSQPQAYVHDLYRLVHLT